MQCQDLQFGVNIHAGDLLPLPNSDCDVVVKCGCEVDEFKRSVDPAFEIRRSQSWPRRFVVPGLNAGRDEFIRSKLRQCEEWGCE